MGQPVLGSHQRVGWDAAGPRPGQRELTPRAERQAEQHQVGCGMSVPRAGCTSGASVRRCGLGGST